MGDTMSAHVEALKTGGLPHIKSLDLIESAIARPYSGYYRSMPAKDAALLESMATNHGFNDGNKRTTLILLKLLIDKSGYKFVMGSRQELNNELEWLVLAAVDHHLRVGELLAWLKHRIVRL